jgi:hypothetical protein
MKHSRLFFLLPVVGVVILGLSVVGVGCVSSVPLSKTDCPKDGNGSSYRNPSTLQCVTNPSQDEKNSFYAFQSLFVYASATSTPIKLRINFRNPIALSDLISSLSSFSSPRSVIIGLTLPDPQDLKNFPTQAWHIPVNLNDGKPVTMESVHLAFDFGSKGMSSTGDDPTFSGEKALVRTVYIEDVPQHLLDYWHSHVTDNALIFPELPVTYWPHLSRE